MPARTKHAPGTPSWTDLMTSDLDAAERFYTSLFGWTYDTQDTGDPERPYVMVLKGDMAVAGMGPQNPEQTAQGIPPMWSTYVTVDDADASAAKAASLGATALLAPVDAMGAGRMAVLADPTGAVFCLWEPKAHIGAELVNEHGALSWNELITPEVDAAAKFYGDLFGWTAQTEDMGTMAYTAFLLGERAIAGAMKPPMDGIPPSWGVYFAVDDTDATVAAATAGGGTVIVEPNDIPPGRMAVLSDPQGAVFSVLALAQPSD